MNSHAVEQYRNLIDESIARLLARASDSRRLETTDLRGRVEQSIEKHVLRADDNAGSGEVKQFIDALAADDLCLIIACERGDEKAWEDLVKNYDGAVKSAARKISNNAEDAEDLAGSIWAELYGLKRGAGGERKTKLAYYSGRGSLGGWLRAVVAQLAVDGFRKSSKFVQIEEAREFENLANDAAAHSDNGKIVHASQNPEENFSGKQTQRDVSSALKQAIANLDAEDKLILKLYYFDNLKLKDIGATLGFHEATASRKMTRIQAETRKSVEKILIKDCGWTLEETKRYLADAAQKLDIGVEKMFAVWLCLALVQEFWK